MAESMADWADEVPEPVQDAAENYMKALRAKNKAQEKVNGARETCLEAMIEHDIERVRIDNGAKWLIREDLHKLKTAKVKSATAEDDDD